MSARNLIPVVTACFNEEDNVSEVYKRVEGWRSGYKVGVGVKQTSGEKHISMLEKRWRVLGQ